MQHQIFRTQRQPALQLTAKSFNRLLQKWSTRPREIDQVIRMNDERLEVIFLPQAVHCFTLTASQRVRLPLPRAARKNLKRVTAEPVGSLRRIFHARGDRGVNPDPPRSPLRSRLRRRPLQRILLCTSKHSHGRDIRLTYRGSRDPAPLPSSTATVTLLITGFFKC